MQEKTYSTGQLSGMTGIPVRTMQGYIQDFRDFFSESARQPSKGRRFTDADIKTLFTIKRARNQRYTDDEVKKILTGEIEMFLANEYNEEDIKTIAVNAANNLEAAIKLFETSEDMLAQCRDTLETLRAENSRMQAENIALRGQIKPLQDWKAYMLKLDSAFNPWAEKAPAAAGTQPEKKKAWGIF